MAEIGIRRAGAEDVAAIRALVHRAYARWIAVIGDEPLPMRADYDRAVRTHAVWLAETPAGLAGVIELAAHADQLLIVNVAIEPAAQGAGLGHRLLALAEAQARAAGLGELRLYTNVLMASNRALYARLGYRETGMETRGALRIVHMAKTITD